MTEQELPVTEQIQPERRRQSRGLLIIAAFKLLKGIGLLIVGFGARHLINADLDNVVEHWVDVFRMDPNNYYIHALVERVTNLDAHKLRALSFGTFFYAGMLLTEGIGLAMRQRWAEYFTIIATSSLIPVEIYEIFRHTTLMKVILLLVNVAVVWYLAWELRRNNGH